MTQRLVIRLTHSSPWTISNPAAIVRCQCDGTLVFMNNAAPFLVVLHFSLGCLVEVLFSMFLNAWVEAFQGFVRSSSSFIRQMFFFTSSLFVSIMVLQLYLHRFSIILQLVSLIELSPIAFVFAIHFSSYTYLFSTAKPYPVPSPSCHLWVFSICFNLARWFCLYRLLSCVIEMYVCIAFIVADSAS